MAAVDDLPSEKLALPLPADEAVYVAANTEQLAHQLYQLRLRRQLYDAEAKKICQILKKRLGDQSELCTDNYLVSRVAFNRREFVMQDTEIELVKVKPIIGGRS